MTVYSTPLGYNSAGILQISATGEVTSVPSVFSGQPVVSASASAAIFNATSGMPAGAVSGVLQQARYNVGGTAYPQIVCPLGNNTTPYSASCDIFGTKTFTPVSSTSTILITAANYGEISVGIIGFNLYINHGSPVAGSQLNCGSGAVYMGCISKLCYTMPSPGVAFTVAMCSFGNGGTYTQSSSPNDWLKITETPTITSLWTPIPTTQEYPQTQAVSGAATVPMISVPCGAGASISVSGQLSFWDTANLASNSISFFFVAQRPSAGNISISQSGYFYQASASTATSITVVASVGTQSAIVNAVGLAGSTWQAQLQYSVVNS